MCRPVLGRPPRLLFKAFASQDEVVQAASLEGRDMGKPTIDQLREQVRGAVIAPDDEGFEQARRVYNAMIDRRPRVIVQCADSDDVVAAVNFARDNELAVAIRG